MIKLLLDSYDSSWAGAACFWILNAPKLFLVDFILVNSSYRNFTGIFNDQIRKSASSFLSLPLKMTIPAVAICTFTRAHTHFFIRYIFWWANATSLTVHKFIIVIASRTITESRLVLLALITNSFYLSNFSLSCTKILAEPTTKMI